MISLAVTQFIPSPSTTLSTLTYPTHPTLSLSRESYDATIKNFSERERERDDADDDNDGNEEREGEKENAEANDECKNNNKLKRERCNR